MEFGPCAFPPTTSDENKTHKNNFSVCNNGSFRSRVQLFIFFFYFSSHAASNKSFIYSAEHMVPLNLSPHVARLSGRPAFLCQINVGEGDALWLQGTCENLAV